MSSYLKHQLVVAKFEWTPGFKYFYTERDQEEDMS